MMLKKRRKNLRKSEHCISLFSFLLCPELFRGNIMKGVAVHASSHDDPYITKHEDSEDEYEKDDFILKDTDNLVVVAKIVKVRS